MARVRRSFLLFVLGLSLALGAAPRVIQAQVADPPIEWDPTAADLTRDWSDEVPAHVSYATGDTWLDRDGVVEASPLNVPLLTGDRLRTGEGRLEVTFADGSLLSFDRQTDAEFLDDTLLRLDRGAVRLELARGTDGYRIDAAGTTTWARSAGEFIVEIDTTVGVTPAVRVLAIRGTADLESNGTASRVDAGYEAWASAETTPSLPRAATVSGGSDFARWIDERQLERTGYQSASYLPAELSSYSGVLDRSGAWEYDSDYGQVWYPSVADEWTPYSTGRWSYVGSYGWTWIGADRWAWPTHHYGRWGHRHGRYFWIPGRHWAPAWVAWASTPSYLGWVALGFDNRPLISISIGYSSGWRGWTYHPIDHFRRRTVLIRRGHYLPPRQVRLHHVYTGPSRPAVTVRTTHRGLRGPARGSVAVPRAGLTRASLGARVSPGRNALSQERLAGTTIDRRGVAPSRTSATTRGAVRVAPGAGGTQRSTTAPPARIRTGPASRTPVDRTGPAAIGRARPAGVSSSSRTIERAPNRIADTPRVDRAPARSGAASAPVQRIDRRVAPAQAPSAGRATPRATPRTAGPDTRQQPRVGQPGIVQRSPGRADVVRSPQVVRPPARAPQVSPERRSPQVGRSPQVVRPSAPRVNDRSSAPAARPRVSAPRVERAPAPRVERAPASRVERAPAPRPARVESSPSRDSGASRSRGGDSPRATGRARPR